MDQVLINGGNQIFPTIPAGLAVVSASNAGGTTLSLNSGESNADMLILNGAPNAGFTAIIGRPAHNSLDFTPLNPPNQFVPATYVGSWIKVIRNDTAQTATIKGTLGDGSSSAGFALLAGECKLVMFDFVNAPFTLTCPPIP